MKKINEKNEEITYFSYTILKSTIKEWLEIVKEYSNGVKELETALEIAKIFAPEKFSEKLETIAILYRAECSGLIKPKIALKVIFAEL